MKLKELKERMSIFTKLSTKDLPSILISVHFIPGVGVEMHNLFIRVLRRFDYTGPEFVTSFKLLYEFISKIKANEWNVILSDDNATFIFDNQNMLTLPVLSLIEYPVVQSIPQKQLNTVLSISDIEKAKSIQGFVVKDELRPAMQSIVFGRDIVATDANIMAFIPRESSQPKFDRFLRKTYVKIKPDVLKLLFFKDFANNHINVYNTLRIFNNEDELNAAIHDSIFNVNKFSFLKDKEYPLGTIAENIVLDKAVIIDNGDTEITFKEISDFDISSEYYPDYKSIIPMYNHINIMLYKSELLCALKSSETINDICVKVTMNSTNTSISLISTNVDTDSNYNQSLNLISYKQLDSQKPSFTRIGFSPNKLMKILQAIPDDVISIYIETEHRAVIINKHYLLMPVMLEIM